MSKKGNKNYMYKEQKKEGKIMEKEGKGKQEQKILCKVNDKRKV